jgi:hypothetical protein
MSDIEEKLRYIREGADTQLLQEAYYGKSAQLLQCEKLITHALKSNDGGVSDIKQVEQILQKLFNFKRLLISTIPFGLALTVPITTFKFKYMFDRIEMQRTATGIAFPDKDQVEAIIFIDVGFILAAEITPKEVVGIILHEIGHSMKMILPSAQLANAIGAMVFINYVWPAIVINYFGSVIVKTVAAVDSFKNKFLNSPMESDILAAKRDTELRLVSVIGNIKAVNRLWKFFQENKTWLSIVNSIKTSAKGVIGLGAKFNAFSMLSGIAGIFKFGSKYKEEVLSDFISTAYGYGPDMISGLSKAHTYVSDVSLDNPIFRLIKLPFNIMNTIFDPHPENITRFKFIIENLEAELKKELNSEVFIEIQKDIQLAKDELAKYQASIAKRPIKNYDIIIFRKVMGKMLDDHDDIRGLFFSLKPDDLKMLDDLEPLPVPVKVPETIQECEQLIQEMANMTSDDRKYITNLIFEN